MKTAMLNIQREDQQHGRTNEQHGRTKNSKKSLTKIKTNSQAYTTLNSPEIGFAQRHGYTPSTH